MALMSFQKRNFQVLFCVSLHFCFTTVKIGATYDHFIDDVECIPLKIGSNYTAKSNDFKL